MAHCAFGSGKATKYELRNIYSTVKNLEIVQLEVVLSLLLRWSHLCSGSKYLRI